MSEAIPIGVGDRVKLTSVFARVLSPHLRDRTGTVTEVRDAWRMVLWDGEVTPTGALLPTYHWKSLDAIQSVPIEKEATV